MEMAWADVTCCGNQCTNATDTAGVLLVYRRIFRNCLACPHHLIVSLRYISGLQYFL